MTAASRPTSDEPPVRCHECGGCVPDGHGPSCPVVACIEVIQRALAVELETMPRWAVALPGRIVVTARCCGAVAETLVPYGPGAIALPAHAADCALAAVFGGFDR